MVWGCSPPEKIALFIPRNENFVKYFVLNVNKMSSITVEWIEDNIFMILKIPLYEGGLSCCADIVKMSSKTLGGVNFAKKRQKNGTKSHL